MNTADIHKDYLNARPAKITGSVEGFDLILTAARLLFANGQTTRTIVAVVQKLGAKFGLKASVFPHWGELTVKVEGASGSRYETVAVEPAGVDMNKVIATMEVVDQVCDGQMDTSAARAKLEAISKFPPVPVVRFTLMAGAGAAALGLIFNDTHVFNLLLVALTAGLGACLRRWLATKTKNLFVQPFSAAWLAGMIGVIAVRLNISTTFHFVAVCPCMVLVPGAHLLNGALDLARARINLGIGRITYAGLVILAICTGLVLGLALGGETLPPGAPFDPAPLWLDVIAAGVAVAAFGIFFNMPWRLLSIPILVGMLAHACRWMLISVAGATAETGALVACFIVGTIMTPVANRLKLPFAGLVFASVVSMIPGVFLFRTAAGMVDIVLQGQQASPELFMQVTSDGITALLILLAMAFGLILPKMCIGGFKQILSGPPH